MPQMPTLSELVGLVLLDGITGPRDPVQQIAAAERIAGEFTVLGESLVGFFVELARAEGCSWGEIGASRGLSRQGAQQRYAPLIAQLTVEDLVRTGGLRGFGDDALGCLRRAQARAGRLGHDAVDSGDLLVAVLDDPGGLAGAVIRALGADPAEVRAGLEGDADATTDRARPAVGQDVRRAIDGALAEAHGAGVTVAHLFLGLLRTPGSRAGQVLVAHGVNRPAALAHLLGLAGRPAGESS
ncbi:Clp protease N-terminal domain-containing protein [Streptomyces sp. CA-111067]|uniref:Clp protease N-terminal domain-containing protein n=1 Tax=Streptomyces sp. CA-111067 TaxID=3240046 RepID=UPI003D98063F